MQEEMQKKDQLFHHRKRNTFVEERCSWSCWQQLVASNLCGPKSNDAETDLSATFFGFNSEFLKQTEALM